MVLNLSCEHEECREPDGKEFYVTVASTGSEYCLFCFLVFERGVDAIEASDIEFQGGEK